jgi:uncharacterized membrane protein (UPF0127 family)
MKNLIGIILLLIFINVSISNADELFLNKLKKQKINVNGRDLIVLLAQNDKEREKGLSNAELKTFNRMGIDGMLFVFNDAGEKTFQAWYMKFDLMLLVLEKKGNNYYVKERKPLRIGTIEKVNGQYILEIPLKNSLSGGF